MTTPDTKAIRENMKALDGVTPGPWYVNGPKKMEIVGRIHSVLNPENYPAAFVPAWDQPMAGEVDGKDEAIANARLIAAAPDMRETILALCDALDDMRAEIERLRAALAFYTVSYNWCIGGPLDGNSPFYTGGPARAVLAQKGGQPQSSASVAEAMKHLHDIINCGNCSGSRQSARLALRALRAPAQEGGE